MDKKMNSEKFWLYVATIALFTTFMATWCQKQKVEEQQLLQERIYNHSEIKDTTNQ